MSAVEDVVEVARVPSDFPVNFALLTEGEKQYVAYYDSNRQMTVAMRRLGSTEWRYQSLPSAVGWDSHNYIAMALDVEGQLHVSGNMHAVPLVYFRTETADDITSLRPMPMTGERESRVTYPLFLKNHQGELIFTYRDGGSGDGVNLYNRYDPATGMWTRLLDAPLFDGEGERNAYPLGPVAGDDGWFHVVWVWRDTPDCATNHHLSHARSRDLVHWESIFGDPVVLPLVLSERRLWVDAIPVNGGIINGCQQLVFDSNHRPIIAYHKSDENGHMQVYAARPEDGKWAISQLTDWQQPIHFSGGGSMGFIGIKISGMRKQTEDVFVLDYRHRDYGVGSLLVDASRLSPLASGMAVRPRYPAMLRELQSDYPGMEIQRVRDLGGSQDPSNQYLLQWETLTQNFDRPRDPPYPPPATLRLYKMRLSQESKTPRQ